MERTLNHLNWDTVQHRQEDRHAVYVRDNKDGNNAKHRQEHGHAVYVVIKRKDKTSRFNSELK